MTHPALETVPFDEDRDELGRLWSRYWCERHTCWHTCFALP